MNRITTWGIGRLLALVALIIIVILIVVGQLAIQWLGLILLLIVLAILL